MIIIRQCASIKWAYICIYKNWSQQRLIIEIQIVVINCNVMLAKQ